MPLVPLWMMELSGGGAYCDDRGTVLAYSLTSTFTSTFTVIDGLLTHIHIQSSARVGGGLSAYHPCSRRGAHIESAMQLTFIMIMTHRSQP